MESGKTRTWEPKLFFLFVCLSVCLHIPSSLVIPSVFTKHFFQFFFIHFSFFFYMLPLYFNHFLPSLSLYSNLSSIVALRSVVSYSHSNLVVWLRRVATEIGWMFVFFGFVYLFIFFFAVPVDLEIWQRLKLDLEIFFFVGEFFARFNRWPQIVRFIRANFKWIGVQFFSQWPKIGFKWDFGLDFKVSSQKIGENLVILSTVSKPFVYFWWTFSSFSVGFQLIGRKLVLNDIFC